MYLDELQESKILEAAKNLCSKDNFKIFGFKVFREAGKIVLRFLVDRPEGGITIDECTSVNRELGNVIEQDNILNESFILEVSSPGLDAVLKTKDDFLRVLNRGIVCYLNKPFNNKLEIKGKLIKVNDNSIVILNNAEIELNMADINKSRQIVTIG